MCEKKTKWMSKNSPRFNFSSQKKHGSLTQATSSNTLQTGSCGTGIAVQETKQTSIHLSCFYYPFSHGVFGQPQLALLLSDLPSGALEAVFRHTQAEKPPNKKSTRRDLFRLYRTLLPGHVRSTPDGTLRVTLSCQSRKRRRSTGSPRPATILPQFPHVQCADGAPPRVLGLVPTLLRIWHFERP